MSTSSVRRTAKDARGSANYCAFTTGKSVDCATGSLRRQGPQSKAVANTTRSRVEGSTPGAVERLLGSRIDLTGGCGELDDHQLETTRQDLSGSVE